MSQPSPGIPELIGELRALTAVVRQLLAVTLEERRPKPPTRDEQLEMRAILLLVEIGPKLREIARQIGLKSHRQMYRWPKFMRYYNAMPKPATGTPRRGYQTEARPVAIDD